MVALFVWIYKAKDPSLLMSLKLIKPYGQINLLISRVAQKLHFKNRDV